jgi:hypothetical protein
MLPGNISKSAPALSIVPQENFDTPIVQLPAAANLADLNRIYYLPRGDEQSVADLVRDSMFQFTHAMLSAEPFSLQ